MTENRKEYDVIDVVCGNRTKRFNGVCKHYNQPEEKQCALLSQQRLERFWEECRLFYETIRVCNEIFQKKYKNLPIDEAEDLDFEAIVQRINPDKLQFDTPGGWHKYIKKIAYRELKKVLVKPKLVSEKKNCGSCQHYPAVKSEPCPQKGEIRKKTDEPCPEYIPHRIRIVSIEPTTPEKEKFHSDSLMKGIDEKRKQENSASSTAGDILTTLLEQEEDVFRFIQGKLKQRARDAKPKSKQSDRYKRQQDVFSVLKLRLVKGTSRIEVIKQLAGKFGSNKKMIYRDIEEIMKFLEQLLSQNDQ